MAQIVPFPLHRRQKLLREIQNARSQHDRRYILERVAKKLERLGILDHTIDEQIGAATLTAIHQQWAYRTAPRGGDAA